MTSTFPAWRTKIEAALDGDQASPEGCYVQVATVRPDGRPANRTLVFHAFLEPDHRLVFTTDLRAAKMAHLALNPWIEACWYFSRSREQFRFTGRAALVTDKGDAREEQARLRTWRQLSDHSRQTFTWPAPGEPRAAVSEFELAAGAEPPLHFALLIVIPRRVDHLELSTRGWRYGTCCRTRLNTPDSVKPR